MNCKIIANNMPGFVSGELSPEILANCERHIMQCSDCRDALRGAEALVLLKNRDAGVVPNGMLEDITKGVAKVSARPQGRTGFWIGTGFGGALAASIFALAFILGWTNPAVVSDAPAAQFTVALSEPRDMEIAIETDRALANASISILLSGGIEIDGYGHRRELSWTTDLQAGINRLSLPVLAVDAAGGQMVVRLDHPDSEQMFVVRLKTDA